LKYSLAIKHNAINLGQGFPTLPVAPFIKEALAEANSSPFQLHQYTRSEGHPRLVKALSNYYAGKLGNNNKTLDPLSEIVVCAGASEAIYSSVAAFINPGDEVILMQPFYDCYPAAVTLNGGVPVIVDLAPTSSSFSSSTTSTTSDEWRVDIQQIRRAITSKTKMIFINNPHNPVGKVWRRDELMEIAELAKEFDLIVVADEVYETLVFDDSVSPMIKFGMSVPNIVSKQY
jgi:aspartate/methionine/tyrosine aminotransferase